MSGDSVNRSRLDRRRRNIVLFLVASAAASKEAVGRLSQRLNVGERTVRIDLDAIRNEVEAPSLDDLPEDLLKAVQAADSFRLLKALGKRVMAEMVQGSITRELGLALTDALREQRHALRAMRDEQGYTALKALEVLMPKEREVLIAYRESLVPKALKPGEFPPPPAADPQPADGSVHAAPDAETPAPETTEPSHPDQHTPDQSTPDPEGERS